MTPRRFFSRSKPTISWIWVSNPISGESSDARSARPVRVGAYTSWEASSKKGMTFCQHQPPCHPPCTSTNVAMLASFLLEESLSSQGLLSPPTTPQSIFPVADQRFDVTGVCFLRGPCGGNRRTPLTGVSERVLEQRGTFHLGDITVVRPSVFAPPESGLWSVPFTEHVS